MRPPTAKQVKLFDFLSKQSGKPFELGSLVAATGYKVESAERSLGEHWANVVERSGTPPAKRWRTTSSFDGMSLAEFHRAISQSKRDPVVGQLRDGRARELASISRAQAHVALELLNRVGLSSRVECFLVLFLNAWELLLKAEIVEREGWDAVFEKTKAGKSPRSVRFDKIVTGLPSSTAREKALQAQLNDLHELRNQAAHLLLCSPSREMLHLFAGSFRSLSERFTAFTGSPLCQSRDVAGYLILVGVVDLSREVVQVPVESPMNERIVNHIAEFGEDYAIPLRVSLRAVDDDLADSAELGVGQVLTSSTKAVRERYRFKRDQVASRVTHALRDAGRSLEVREHHVDLVRRREEWGTTSENPFATKFPAATLYSQAACDRMVELLKERPDYLEVAQRQEQQRQARRNRKSKSKTTAAGGNGTP